MNHKNLEQLDFFRVREIVSSFAMTQEGKENVLSILPYTDKKQISNAKNLSKDWADYLQAGNSRCFLPWNPCSEILEFLKVEGACLSQDDIYAIGQLCLSVSKFCGVFCKSDFTQNSVFNGKYQSLEKIAKDLPSLVKCENLIFKIIDKNGELRDLPEIKNIQNQIKKKRNEIESIIKNYTTDSNYQEMLQSSVPVLRSGRQMLAVKSGFKNRIKGIVHEVSQTGQTFYIEPEEIVRCSNELIEEQAKLERELKRIFTQLTKDLSEFYYDLKQSLELMIKLDVAYASSQWGLSNKCIYAQNCNFETENLSLVGASHPLLGEKAVPIDVIFNHGCKVLIITGANTGGKTVTLKTIALFSLLNQAGFPVPAKDGTKLPIFNSVFADIGDEQSLEQSLSTFSGHMQNIGQMLQVADENSLILLDELGSGTDPQEGGAIAMAILDEFIARKSFVILTTHHGILKNYGYTHPQCQNASVEFDGETLSPTYKIVMGVPGESHALDIAKRNGISKDIIQKACSYIENKQADVSTLIKGLTEKYKELSELEKSFKTKEHSINEKWRKVDLKELRLKQHEFELKEQGYKKSKDFLDESRKMLENLVRELREGEITREKTLKVKETIANLSKAVELENQSLEEAEEELEQFSKDKNMSQIENKVFVQKSEFYEGQKIRFGKNKTEATLLQKQKNDKWLVQSGNIKLTIKESDIVQTVSSSSKNSVSIEIVKTEDEHKERVGNLSKLNPPSIFSEKPVFELRLLGMRYEQAIKAVEKQLDLCVINNFKNFSIIHGKGNGVLQTAVWDYLKTYPGIASFHFANPEDGGTGKTYVTLE